MAYSVEALKEKLKKEQQKAADTAKQLKAAAKAEKAKEAQKNRKQDTRRKIIIGGFFLAKIKQDNPHSQVLYKQFIESLTKDSDRRAFGLEPLPKKD